MFEARDIMSTKVISIRPEATIGEAIDKLIEENISGMPVIDEWGMLVGVISEFQLLEITYDPTIRASVVREFMTRDVLTVTPKTLLPTIANLFVIHRIRRVPVVENNRVVGVISRGDILKYMKSRSKPIDTFFAEIRSATETTHALPEASAQR